MYIKASIQIHLFLHKFKHEQVYKYIMNIHKHIHTYNRLSFAYRVRLTHQGYTNFKMLSTAQLRAQRNILMSFYRATGGEQWKRKDNWGDESKPVSSFYGVTVDKRTGAVMKIQLSSNGLSGTTCQNSSFNRLYVSHTHHHPSS